MAVIIKDPQLEDYFVEIGLAEAARRPHGIIDLYEDGKVVLLKDHRLDLDYDFLARVDLTPPDHADDTFPTKRIKKMQLTDFSPKRVGATLTPFQTILIEHLFAGNEADFRYFAEQADSAYAQIRELLVTLFPGYALTDQSLTYRFSDTLFENLHWDSFPGYPDRHQVRVFCNVDDAARIWTLSHQLHAYLDAHYEELDLGRVRHDNPNAVVQLMDKEVLGGMRKRCVEGFPKHHVSFQQGEIWFADSRAISHQVYYGRRAIIYALEVDIGTMQDPSKRFDARIAALHEKHAAIAYD